MGTPVVHGEKSIVAEVEDGDLAALNECRSSFSRRDIFAPGDSYPPHDGTLSIGRSGMNCVGLTGDCPSSHASCDAAFDFWSRSRRPARAESGAYAVSFRTLSM